SRVGTASGSPCCGPVTEANWLSARPKWVAGPRRPIFLVCVRPQPWVCSSYCAAPGPDRAPRVARLLLGRLGGGGGGGISSRRRGGRHPHHGHAQRPALPPHLRFLGDGVGLAQASSGGGR